MPSLPASFHVAPPRNNIRIPFGIQSCDRAGRWAVVGPEAEVAARWLSRTRPDPFSSSAPESSAPRSPITSPPPDLPGSRWSTGPVSQRAAPPGRPARSGPSSPRHPTSRWRTDRSPSSAGCRRTPESLSTSGNTDTCSCSPMPTGSMPSGVRSTCRTHWACPAGCSPPTRSSTCTHRHARTTCSGRPTARRTDRGRRPTRRLPTPGRPGGRARRSGRSAAVTGFLRDTGGAVCGVATTDGPIDADTVIVAAGPQSRELCRTLDLDIPVAPHRRQVCAIGPLDWVHPALPFVVDMGTGAYLHPGSAGA